jgi:DNA repair protein RadA/Sms
MSKPTSIFICQKCDAQYPKWTGRCSECGSWGTIKETPVAAAETPKIRSAASASAPGKTISFSTVGAASAIRISTGIGEVDRVLGGGLIPGSVILLSGEPGNGKSTLASQMLDKVGRMARPDGKPGKTLYVSGEESAEQVKMRLDRLGAELANLHFLGETDAPTVAATISAEQPSVAVIDSIQTMSTPSSEAGSLSAIRSSAAILAEGAKSSGVPLVLIGQVTKEGSAAGPKTLEHLVDVVLTLEGDRESRYRTLRAEKNRFGSTDEVGVFIMEERGLCEVKNPSEIFVRERSRLPGSCMTCIAEGSRAMLVEVQALVHPSSWSSPVRRASGFDINRLQMIIAVLSSRARLPLGKADVHLNVVGGIRLREPAADLAIALAVYSAAKNSPLAPDLCAFGEIGLGGELRSVRATDRRMTEAIRFGLKRVMSPPDTKTVSDAISGI